MEFKIYITIVIAGHTITNKNNEKGVFSMAKFITHRMTLFSLAYCDWYQTVCKELGITEEAILAKLHPKYKEKKEDGTEFGKDRCDRFMFWANHKKCNAEDHYQRLDMVKRYITTIYPRLVREVANEEAIAQLMKDLELENLEHEPKVPHIQDRLPVSGYRPEPMVIFVHDLRKTKKKKKVKENPNQMEFDFGEEFK